MLKTVSSITNAIGALNYRGTWDANTNSPALASGVGTKGDYYVVSTAGNTNLDGVSTWYVGDWATFNGSVWQRLEGGVDDPAPSLKSNSTTGLMQITGPAAGQTRVMTIPDANFSVARTDAANSFAGTQTVSTGGLVIATFGQQLLLGNGAQAGCVTANRSNNLPNNGTMTISVPWASTYPLSYLVVAGQIRTADGRFETNQVDFLNSFGTFTNITTQQGSLAAWPFTLSFSAGVITFTNTGGGDANASIAVFGIGRLL